MLGVVGYVTQEVARFPGEVAPGIKFADVPNGVKALEVIPALGWMQILFLIGAVDYYGFFEYPQTNPKLAPEEMERRSLSELT
jgi:Chlorophyll A-B binding protein